MEYSHELVALPFTILISNQIIDKSLLRRAFARRNQTVDFVFIIAYLRSFCPTYFIIIYTTQENTKRFIDIPTNQP